MASIITLQFKSTLVYKYGAADERFFRLGGFQKLMWRAIEEAKEKSLKEFDLGRSEWSQQGLITFKDRLGASRTTLSYLRRPLRPNQTPVAEFYPRSAKRAFAYLPSWILSSSGRLLYRHFG